MLEQQNNFKKTKRTSMQNSKNPHRTQRFQLPSINANINVEKTQIPTKKTTTSTSWRSSRKRKKSRSPTTSCTSPTAATRASSSSRT